jgi:P-type Ca2+ transporter type 2C
MAEDSFGRFNGLNSAQADALLQQHGPNELPSAQSRWYLIALGVFREPMLGLLLATAILYLLIGESTEAWLLFGSSLVVIAINIVQDVRSERAVQALRDLSSPRAVVIRNNERTRIAAREIVPGDIMILEEGDRIAADAELLESLNLSVNESLLTGESIPVTKHESNAARVFSGALVVSGSAIARVIATGPRTEIGKIGIALSTIEQTRTPLERQTGKLVRKLAILGIGCSVLIGAVIYLQQASLVTGILMGLALAMSLLPEEIPVVLTTFLALGARRLSSIGILVRKMSAVEALGTVTVLCVDKTGTLTKNEIELVESYTVLGGVTSVSHAPREIIDAALQSSRAMSYDPMDLAVFRAAQERSIPIPDGELYLQHPITHDLPALTQIWQRHSRYEIAMKGAPEVVLGLCQMPQDIQASVRTALSEFTTRGLRVLAVAHATVETLPAAMQEYPLTFSGLLAFADPIREDIAEAVQECYAAGIRVVMITGDHPETAEAIASQAGIKHAENVLLGSYLQETLSPAAMAATNVFARVVPMQKLSIVRALQSAGEIVVMTGDGVNDAPALRAANIGVAMGARGTDVAREAAAVILTSDDFGSLVRAIRLGRRTYDNIKKAMYYIVAMHVPIAGLALLPIILGAPLILFPVHIVLLELLLDPMSTLVFESEGEEENLMRRPPRDPNEPIFQGKGLTIAALQGASILAVCTAIYLWVAPRDPVEARTLTFITLMLSNVCLALVNRSWSKVFWQTLAMPNKMLWAVVIAAMILLLAITQVTSLSTLFGFSAFHLHDWIICGAAAMLSLTWFEILKLFVRRRLTL